MDVAPPAENKDAEYDKYKSGLKTEIDENKEKGTATVFGHELLPWQSDTPPPQPDPEVFATQFGFSADNWIIERANIKFWDVTLKPAVYEFVKEKTATGKKTNRQKRQSDKPTQFRNYGLTVNLKRRFPFDVDKFKKEFIEDTKGQSHIVNKYKFHKIDSNGHLGIISINDVHLGRLAWREETGQDYDLKIAIANTTESINQHIKYLRPYPLNEIWLFLGHDYFNYDYAFPFPQTEHGRPMASDGRWPKIYRMGRLLATEVIDILSTICPVRVFIVPGNHDPQTTFYLGDGLEARYFNNKNVAIDNSPQRRKYDIYGDNLIGMSHGQKEKQADLFAIMMADNTRPHPEWLQKKWKYFYLGHRHHETNIHKSVGQKVKVGGLKENILLSEDYKGLFIDYMPNVAFRDNYEYETGFVGTIRSSFSAIHHKTMGRVARFNYNL